MFKIKRNRKKEKSIMYLRVILAFLVIYLVWLGIFFYNSNSQITHFNSKIQQNQEGIREMNKRIMLIKSQNKKIVPDLYTDNSITKFVNSKVSFNDKAYIPENLVSLSSDYIYDAKWWSQLIKKETNSALQKMWEAFYKEFNKKISVVSAYRSYKYQKWIKDRGCPDNLCAKAWYSEHQSWLAVDLWETTTQSQFMSKPHLAKYYNWLSKNAHNYGFHNTYTKWLEIDWYEIEPWHWRYLWVELATELKQRELSLAEYYNENK